MYLTYNFLKYEQKNYHEIYCLNKSTHNIKIYSYIFYDFYGLIYFDSDSFIYCMSPSKKSSCYPHPHLDGVEYDTQILKIST